MRKEVRLERDSEKVEMWKGLERWRQIRDRERSIELSENVERG